MSREKLASTTAQDGKININASCRRTEGYTENGNGDSNVVNWDSHSESSEMSF